MTARRWVVQPLASVEEARGTSWHHYTESGLDNVWLQGGVAHHETPYGSGVAIEDVEGLNAAIASWIVERKSYWSGHELKFLRKRLDLSQKGLADLLGYSDQQVRRWENDIATMPNPASRLLRLLVREWETKASDRAPEFMRALLEHAVEADGIKVSVSAMAH